MFKWKLRSVMAEKGIWNGQELVQLLEERAGIILSHTAVMALIKSPPKAVRLQTFDALCTALECNPWELLEYTPEKAKQARKAANNGPIAPYRRQKIKPQTKQLYPEEDF